MSYGISLSSIAVSLFATSLALAQDAPSPRINPLLGLLDQDKGVFAQWVNYIGAGSDPQSAISQTSSGFDFVIYDMEHSGFDISKFQNYLQWLLDRRAIAENGLMAQMPVIVRLPPNGRESSEWMIKNVLDSGAHGILFPFIETVDQVENAVRMMRYPQLAGSPDLEPAGKRGWSPSQAARYWGLSTDEYTEEADLWRKDDRGNLLPLFLIETETGVNNVRAMAEYLHDNQIGAVFYGGSADLGRSLGGDPAKLDAALNLIYEAGKEFDIPVAVNWPNEESGFGELFDKGGSVFVGVGGVSLPGEEMMSRLGRN